MLVALQCYLRNDYYSLNGENAHRYSASISNQQIENWWSHFHRICSNWCIHFLKTCWMQTYWIYMTSFTWNVCGFVCMEYFRGYVVLFSWNTSGGMWFRFHGILHLSSHYIRFSCHETVGGVPDILYFLPERSNAVDCLVPLTLAKITEAKALYEPEEQDKNLYQESFHYVLENNNIQYPTNHTQAYDLFLYFVNIQ